MTVMLFIEIIHFIEKSYDHTCNNTCAVSHWLAQLASLLFVLIRLLIATKMASDFGDATFTFKIDSAFNFEMNDNVQIDARENGKS